MKREWWHSLTVYQIYTRSFCDSNGDGIGDFGGILQKLDYLQEIGMTTVEFQPVYEFDETPEKTVPKTSGELAAVAGEKNGEGKLPGYRVLNYWGYREGFYYAPKAAYAAGEDPAEEFRLMVKEFHKRKMEVILQKPELPTGCESVALTMVLKQKGYPIEKTTIAEEYLIYNRDNYASGYVGDPSTYGGVGIYPPGLVNTANRFLKQRYQQHTAYDVSKLSLEELFPYVAAGNPVLLWLTSDLEDPYFSSQSVEYGGDSYRWYWNEHCVVLGGYNLEKQSVTLFDPLKGKVEESLERVEEIYDQTGKYAMTVY